jgi:predicted nuclease with TOPRIM domain
MTSPIAGIKAMRPHLSQATIRPKVSTMPRQKTEAAAYLDIYKLVNEKKRLQLELGTLDQRKERIQERLQVIEAQVEQLEQNAHDLRDELPIAPSHPAIHKAPTTESGAFNTLFLEY